MKKLLAISLLAILLFAFNSNASAKGVIVYHNGTQISTVKELPEDAVIDDQHVNLGVSYEQFGLFWLPVWNYGETNYVLISDDEKTYWDLDAQLLANIKEEYNLDIPDTPSIPFWQKVGLKPIIILLIAFMIWGQFGKKEEEEPLSQENQDGATLEANNDSAEEESEEKNA